MKREELWNLCYFNHFAIINCISLFSFYCIVCILEIVMDWVIIILLCFFDKASLVNEVTFRLGDFVMILKDAVTKYSVEQNISTPPCYLHNKKVSIVKFQWKNCLQLPPFKLVHSEKSKLCQQVLTQRTSRTLTQKSKSSKKMKTTKRDIKTTKWVNPLDIIIFLLIFPIKLAKLCTTI